MEKFLLLLYDFAVHLRRGDDGCPLTGKLFQKPDIFFDENPAILFIEDVQNADSRTL